jgi:hypothetical protein
MNVHANINEGDKVSAGAHFKVSPLGEGIDGPEDDVASAQSTGMLLPARRKAVNLCIRLKSTYHADRDIELRY